MSAIGMQIFSSPSFSKTENLYETKSEERKAYGKNDMSENHPSFMSNNTINMGNVESIRNIYSAEATTTKKKNKKSHIQTFRTPSKCFSISHSISCARFDPGNNTPDAKNIRH